jgi:predicted transcriptional regulator
MPTTAIQAPVGDTQPVAETKVRTVRVDDELWEAAQKKAKRRRETVAAVIKRALLAYVEEEG